MNKIAILADSACNVNEDIDNGIFVVPLYVNFKNFSKKDGLEIEPKELYEIIDVEIPTTSAPSIDDYLQKIEYIKSLGYEKILGFTMTGTGSGSFNAMRLAFEQTDIGALPIDTKRGAVASGILVYYGKKLIDDGMDFNDIYEKLMVKRDDVRFLIVVEDLKYFQRGGRISHLKGLIGRILRLSPILSLNEEGMLYPVETNRGKRRSMRRFIKRVKEEIAEMDNYFMAMNYPIDVSDIKEIKEELKEGIEGAEFYYDNALTAVLAAHSGPNTTIVSYMEI